MITFLIAALTVGMFFYEFWEELCEWATAVLDALGEMAEVAWSYITRVGGLVVKQVRHIANGRIYATTTPATETTILSDDEIDQMVPDPLTYEQAQNLKIGKPVNIARLN